MNDELAGMPFVIALSRKSKQIIQQNLWISLGMVAILIPLTLFGIAHIGPAVVAHEGSTILVVFNALRLLRFQYEMQYLFFLNTKTIPDHIIYFMCIDMCVV